MLKINWAEWIGYFLAAGSNPVTVVWSLTSLIQHCRHKLTFKIGFLASFGRRQLITNCPSANYNPLISVCTPRIPNINSARNCSQMDGSTILPIKKNNLSAVKPGENQKG